jgi:hypothetical protein
MCFIIIPFGTRGRRPTQVHWAAHHFQNTLNEKNRVKFSFIPICKRFMVKGPMGAKMANNQN